MKTVNTALLAALLVFAIGCSSDKSVNTTDDSALNYNVIGTDAPASVDAAFQELAEHAIAIPNPVANDDVTLNSDFSPSVVREAIENSPLDEEGRVHFRRILAHLHERMLALRACMETNDDPQLRRLGHGAAQAIRHGLRALHEGHPRAALEYFHLANRALNVAGEICHGRG